MTAKKEQKIGIVPRGTIVQLAKSMLRQKISACEAAVRNLRWSRPDRGFKPSQAPPFAHEAARKLVKAKAEVEKLKKSLESSGYDLDYHGKLTESHSVRSQREAAETQRQEHRLRAANKLREETLIALVDATDAPSAAVILRGLREKLDAI